MAWYYYIAGAALLCLACGAVILFAPLRIFVRYLRENRTDQVTLTIRLVRCGVRISVVRCAENSRFGAVLLLGGWEIRVPGLGKVIRVLERTYTKIRSRASRREKRPSGRPGFSLALAGKALETFHAVRPQLKKLTWKRFDLEVIFGLDDPVLTGLAAGSGWFVSGVLLGCLERFFSVETTPRFMIRPQFSSSELRLHWESEVSLPLFRWLKIALLTRKKLEVF
ncbi:MAG: DUF2953 domain-containing protein [Bacillota bacterium]